MTKRHWLDLRDSGIGKFVGKSSYDQLLEIMAVTGGLAKKAFSIYLHKSVPIKTCPYVSTYQLTTNVALHLNPDRSSV
jgi:hypothetical protein